MIGKVIGAFVGDKVAKQTSGIGGAGGAALGVIAASVLRRMSLPAVIALGAGGYLAKKYSEKREREKTLDRSTASVRAPVSKPVSKATTVPPTV